ncbi:MAG TPA: DUF2791 family P-loop domain-containing protein [Acholeplasmataceae bacterium]|nr:DUF2791 family P-loop domain-containing protein [Acholeplasmataceae bacterium]
MRKIPKRIATTIMNSLKGGVVPRIGLGYITVGREQEINALLKDIEIIKDGGATFRFIVGRYGSGKSFLLQTIRSYAMDLGFVVVDADLSPERRLTGSSGQGVATYKELMQNMSIKTRTEGGALPVILQKWLLGVEAEIMEEKNISRNDLSFQRHVESKIYEMIYKLEGVVSGFDFAKALLLYCEATYNLDEDIKSKVMKWFRGEYHTKTESKKELGINAIINDSNWYEYLKIYSLFFKEAGYSGLLVMIDELVNIFKVPNSITRQYNYEKILTLYNDTLQGKANNLGIIMSGTPEAIEDTRRGVFSYEALRSRLEDSRFANDEIRDLLAPIIRLSPLTSEETFVLIEKIAFIHSDLYEYDLKVTADDMMYFIKVEYERLGASKNLTVREVIRDFIEILNILYQHPEKTFHDILEKEDFEYTNPEEAEDILEEFVGFEI